MTDFVTRVELHGATPEDYTGLDAIMAQANFATEVRSAHGVSYKLPSATYFSQSFVLSASEVRNVAMERVRTLGKRYDIVTTSGDMAYFLHPV